MYLVASVCPSALTWLNQSRIFVFVCYLGTFAHSLTDAIDWLVICQTFYTGEHQQMDGCIQMHHLSAMWSIKNVGNFCDWKSDHYTVLVQTLMNNHKE